MKKKHKIKNKKLAKGFTLIELLVVIAIIGLLSSMVLVAMNSARMKARDARRVSDIKQIATAMEMYYVDKEVYPINILIPGSVTTPIPPGVKDAIAIYLSVVSDDPLGDTRGYYWRLNDSLVPPGSNYCVFVQDEADSRYIVASKAGVGKRSVLPNSFVNCVPNL